MRVIAWTLAVHGLNLLVRGRKDDTLAQMPGRILGVSQTVRAQLRPGKMNAWLRVFRSAKESEDNLKFP